MVPITAAAAKVAVIAHILKIRSIMPTPLFHPPTGGCWPSLTVVAATIGGAPFTDLEEVTSLTGIAISPLSLLERLESILRVFNKIRSELSNVVCERLL